MHETHLNQKAVQLDNMGNQQLQTHERVSVACTRSQQLSNVLLYMNHIQAKSPLGQTKSLQTRFQLLGNVINSIDIQSISENDFNSLIFVTSVVLTSGIGTVEENVPGKYISKPWTDPYYRMNVHFSFPESDNSNLSGGITETFNEQHLKIPLQILPYIPQFINQPDREQRDVRVNTIDDALERLSAKPLFPQQSELQQSLQSEIKQLATENPFYRREVTKQLNIVLANRKMKRGIK